MTTDFYDTPDEQDDLLDRAADELDAERGVELEQESRIEELANEIVAEEARDVREEVYGPTEEQLMRELKAWGLIPGKNN